MDELMSSLTKEKYENQLGKLNQIALNYFQITWITEEGEIPNIPMYLNAVKLPRRSLRNNMYINFSCELNPKKGWQSIGETIDYAVKMQGVIRAIDNVPHILSNENNFYKVPKKYTFACGVPIYEHDIVTFYQCSPTFKETDLIASQLQIITYGTVEKQEGNTFIISWRGKNIKHWYNVQELDYIQEDCTVSFMLFMCPTADTERINQDSFTCIDKGIIKSMPSDDDTSGLIEGEINKKIYFNFDHITNTEVISVNSKVLVKYNRKSIPNLKCYPILNGTIKNNQIITEDNLQFELIKCHILGNFPLENGDPITFIVDERKEAIDIIFNGVLIGKPEPYKKNQIIFDFRGRNVLYKQNLPTDQYYSCSILWNREWLRFEAINVIVANKYDIVTNNIVESITNNNSIIESNITTTTNNIPNNQITNIDESSNIQNQKIETIHQISSSQIISNKIPEKTFVLYLSNVKMRLYLKTTLCSYTEFVDKVIDKIKKKPAWKDYDISPSEINISIKKNESDIIQIDDSNMKYIFNDNYEEEIIVDWKENMNNIFYPDIPIQDYNYFMRPFGMDSLMQNNNNTHNFNFFDNFTPRYNNMVYSNFG
jgi:hypothetical protein